MSREMISVNNLTKKIRRRIIIDNLNFKVNEGEICGFIGPNGAGKTTMIRILTGLIGKTSGEVYLNGVDVTKDRKKALENLGAIVEEPIFFPYLTGEEALLNLSILNEGMTKEEREEKVKEVIKIVRLEGREGDKVSTYSLGMKQRLGIAQALLNNPKVIILDEPTNGLDPIGIVDLRELILNLNKERGITFFISSHLLDELQKICNNLVMIKEGKLVWSGSKNDLLNTMKDSNNLEEVFVNLMK
ncbi:ABC transporter ATP-binding protein [Clostridium fallax]|uniref:ABC-type multidrug transport system, ATPase component n=1 Tax=Clostridium fallax TaxID=1533 RepID=A0A1M4SLF3_9CLOT|nr:ATP-binding cassette domain-containing protein [Clostridium fallax]SHE33036.1 ABC-type multidrug transport system, ATPase component [Clostridium fallax]SQB07879.1 ABC transporter ATPase [Clostridium fallax]